MSIQRAAYDLARHPDEDMAQRWQRFAHSQIKARNLQPILDRLNEVYSKNQRAMDRMGGE